MSARHSSKARVSRACALLLLLFNIGVAFAGADELWVAPTSQQDVGGLGIASNAVWPATPFGASRFAWGVPNNLQTFQHAKIAIIPHAPGAATLAVIVCGAQNGQPVGGTCAGPFSRAFTGVANQLIEVDISADLAPRIGAAGLNHLAVLAYTTPTTGTDHLVGLRFAFVPKAPTGVATLGANTFTGTQTAPAFVGGGSALTGVVPSGPAGGDLAGTFPNPAIGTGRVTSGAIADGAITNADINNAAGIAASKIAGLGSLATMTPTGTPGSGTFLRGDGAWSPSGPRVLSGTGQFVGFLIGFDSTRTLTVMTASGYFFKIFTSGQFVPDQIYWSGTFCTGTPFMNDGSGTAGGRLRFAKAIAFASDTNTLYAMSSPNANGESTSALQTIQSFRNTTGTTGDGIGACTANGNAGGWALTAMTPATVGIPVAAGSNPLRVNTPLQIQ